MTDPMHTGPMLARREMTQMMMLVSAGFACAPFGAATASSGGAPFKDSNEELRAFMKLQTRADDGYTDYFNAGTVYASLPAQQSVPMYAYEGLLRFHTRVVGPNAYEVTFIEAGTYLDLKTKQRIDRFQNPVSGVTNPVEHIVEGPMSWQWTTDSLHVTSPMPILRRRVAWQKLGDDTALHFDNIISGALPDGAALNAAALVTYVGSTSQMQEKRGASVANTVLIDTSINPWAPWLKMGDTPGRLANNIIGRKLGALSEAPERLVQYIAANHPKVLKDVKAWSAAS